MRREFHVRFCEGGGVRFLSATRLVVGFEHESEGRRFLEDLRERFRKFGLELHPEKTRLIEFGRFANRDRTRRGENGSAETFRFLGLVHICSKSKQGGYLLARHTDSKRMRATLKALKVALQRRRHEPVPMQGRWLGSVLRGYFAYHAVPTNIDAMDRFRTEVIRTWARSLRRRSQRHRLSWERMNRLATWWMLRARIQLPWPQARFDAKTRGGSPVR